jgi:ankyrin repeat protein
MTAIRNGSVKSIVVLATNGVDLNDINGGHSYLYWATYYQQPGCVTSLLESGADLHKAPEGAHWLLTRAIELQYVGDALALLERGAPVRKPQSREATALAAALSISDSEARNELISAIISSGESGNAIYQRNPGDGRTVLMWGCWLGDLELVELLLKSGADPLLVDTHGRTAIDYSLDGAGTRHEAIVSVLQEFAAHSR